MSKKMTEISALGDAPKQDPDWDAFTEQYKKQFPKHYAERLASGEWEGKVKEDYLKNFSK